eukprot:1158019-Pelagomonas_calceolata.AAC.8
MVNTVYVVTKRTSIRGGRPVEPIILRSRPEGVADLLVVSKLTGWVVGFLAKGSDIISAHDVLPGRCCMCDMLI